MLRLLRLYIAKYPAPEPRNSRVRSPPIGSILRIQAEAEDRCARGKQVGRSGVVHLQVVSVDELFYEILIHQRQG